jgi:hypothetical protein
MPRIVNAYEPTSALGDSLQKLGESIYGDQAQKELYRQKAIEARRGNDNADSFATAVRDGDKNNIAYYGALGNHTGADTGQFNLVSRTNHATGMDDPSVGLAQLGAGGSAASTFAGQGRSLANDSSIAAGHDATSRANNADSNTTTLKANDMTSQRQADTQLAIAGRTLAPVDNGDGTAHYDTSTNAAAGHMAVPVTKEGVLGAMLKRYAAGNAPTSVADASPNAPADPAATPAPTTPQPQANPFSGMPQQIQHLIGVGMPPQSMVHPVTGQTGVSYDGGQNIVDNTGRTIPATGFLPVGQEAAGQARDNNVRAGAANPLVVQSPVNGQAAADADRTAGLGPKVGTMLNNELGAIPGVPAIMQGAWGSPEVAPGVQRAREQQEVRNNQARAVLLGAPGRQTTQAQKWVNELLPQGDAFTNHNTEAAKIPTIVNALQGDHEQLRQLAIDPNTLPAERVKATQQMHQIENTLRMYTDPASPDAPTFWMARDRAQRTAPPAGAPAQAAAAPQVAAPAPTQTATGPGGKKIGLVNGQWVPISRWCGHLAQP